MTHFVVALFYVGAQRVESHGSVDIYWLFSKAALTNA